MKEFNVGKSGIENGLVMNRGCTDFLCLIIFAAFLGSMGFLTFYGQKNGDVSMLLAPLDGDLNFCGESRIPYGGADMTGFPKLYITSFTGGLKEIFGSAVCVEECPSKGMTDFKCVELKDKSTKCD
jgi:hypothetical protein